MNILIMLLWMTCCFNDTYLLKNCEFITSWYSPKKTPLEEESGKSSLTVLLIYLSQSVRRGLIVSVRFYLSIRPPGHKDLFGPVIRWS